MGGRREGSEQKAHWGKEGARKERRERNRAGDRGTSHGPVPLVLAPHPHCPHVPIPACPYPQTFNQQLEGLSATEEWDRGHRGFTYVGASGIEGNKVE